MEKETPRNRIKRLNRQIEYLKNKTPYANFCEQPLCSFCRYFKVWRDYEGGTEADCLKSAFRWVEASGNEINRCAVFEPKADFGMHVLECLNNILYRVVEEQERELMKHKTPKMISPVSLEFMRDCVTGIN